MVKDRSEKFDTPLTQLLAKHGDRTELASRLVQHLTIERDRAITASLNEQIGGE